LRLLDYLLTLPANDAEKKFSGNIVTSVTSVTARAGSAGQDPLQAHDPAGSGPKSTLTPVDSPGIGDPETVSPSDLPEATDAELAQSTSTGGTGS
jgi:hypothetical protein